MLLAALILTASAARGAQFNWTPEIYPVPVIPHGLDWSIQLAPDPQPAVTKLSSEELAQILPPILKLDHANGEYDFARFGSPSSTSPIGPITAIVTAATFLLAAYDLIPRIHLRILKFRLLNLN